LYMHDTPSRLGYRLPRAIFYKIPVNGVDSYQKVSSENVFNTD